MHKDFETLCGELKQTLDGLDDKQTQLRPEGDAARWSIQQTIEHLLLTYAATDKVFEARIAKGTGTKARPSLMQRLGQIMIIRAGLFPKSRTAPEMVRPAKEHPAVAGGTLIERVGSELESLDKRIMAGESVFGDRQRAVSHLVLGPLSTNQWRRFHLIHARHHMKFVARVRKEFGL